MLAQSVNPGRVQARIVPDIKTKTVDMLDVREILWSCVRARAPHEWLTHLIATPGHPAPKFDAKIVQASDHSLQ